MCALQYCVKRNLHIALVQGHDKTTSVDSVELSEDWVQFERTHMDDVNLKSSPCLHEYALTSIQCTLSKVSKMQWARLHSCSAAEARVRGGKAQKERIFLPFQRSQCCRRLPIQLCYKGFLSAEEKSHLSPRSRAKLASGELSTGIGMREL